MQGWIKLHRKIRLNPIFNNLQLFRLWVICLTEATHKSYDQIVGNQIVKLEPGQFVTGRYDLHEKYNQGLKKEEKVAEYTVWRWLKTLEDGDFLSINSSNKFSVISITNWCLYQGSEQENEQQMSNKRATNEQQMSTNKNVKNVENEKNVKKKKESRKQAYDDDSPYMKMVVYFLGKIREWKPDFLFKGSHQTWADDFRKIHELDNRSKESIKAVIDWATNDVFWQSNILSPATLRKQYDKLEGQMKRGGSANEKAKPNPRSNQRSSLSEYTDLPY